MRTKTLISAAAILSLAALFTACSSDEGGIPFLPPSATADNVVGSYAVYTYDANSNRTRQVYYTGPGPDGTWFTANDEYADYYGITYDANGNMIRMQDA